jgi:hypothetical protein
MGEWQRVDSEQRHAASRDDLADELPGALIHFFDIGLAWSRPSALRPSTEGPFLTERLAAISAVYLRRPRGRSSDQEPDMKKLKHEAELFKGALLAGVKYAEGRKAVEFEQTDSASQKLLYIYRLLVHDKIIQPLPEDQVAEASMRHKLAIWYSKQLPKDHPLLN